MEHNEWTIANLKKEISRLKATIRAAESEGVGAGDGGEFYEACPWCWQFIGSGPKKKREHTARHHPNCRAFTPRGAVR